MLQLASCSRYKAEGKALRTSLLLVTLVLGVCGLCTAEEVPHRTHRRLLTVPASPPVQATAPALAQSHTKIVAVTKVPAQANRTVIVITNTTNTTNCTAAGCLANAPTSSIPVRYTIDGLQCSLPAVYQNNTVSDCFLINDKSIPLVGCLGAADTGKGCNVCPVVQNGLTTYHACALGAQAGGSSLSGFPDAYIIGVIAACFVLMVAFLVWVCRAQDRGKRESKLENPAPGQTPGRRPRWLTDLMPSIPESPSENVQSPGGVPSTPRRTPATPGSARRVSTDGLQVGDQKKGRFGRKLTTLLSPEVELSGGSSRLSRLSVPPSPGSVGSGVGGYQDQKLLASPSTPRTPRTPRTPGSGKRPWRPT